MTSEEPEIYVVEDANGHYLSIHRTKEGAETVLEFKAGAAKISIATLHR